MSAPSRGGDGHFDHPLVLLKSGVSYEVSQSVRRISRKPVFLTHRRIRRTRPNIALVPDSFSRLGRIFDTMRAMKAALPLKRAIDVLHRPDISFRAAPSLPRGPHPRTNQAVSSPSSPPFLPYIKIRVRTIVRTRTCVSRFFSFATCSSIKRRSSDDAETPFR